MFVVFRTPVGGTDHVVAASGDFPAESFSAPKLEIQHAVYAAIDGAGEMDVTAKLAELVADGQLVVEASNDALGRDPTAKS